MRAGCASGGHKSSPGLTEGIWSQGGTGGVHSRGRTEPERHEPALLCSLLNPQHTAHSRA